jgi:excisionase family DNA binding protein
VIVEVSNEQADELLRQLGAPPVESREWISVAEKARRLGVSRATVYRHARELDGEKIGSIWRFPPDSTLPAPERKVKRTPRKRGPQRRKRMLEVRGQTREMNV